MSTSGGLRRSCSSAGFVFLPNNHISCFLILQINFSAMISSQSSRNLELNLWLWHVILWSNQLCIQFLSFSYPSHHRIHHLLPLSAATAIQKLDYCNSLYSGISQANLNKLQRSRNSLAHVIANTWKYQHITPNLKKLHWLSAFYQTTNWLQTPIFSDIKTLTMERLT